MSPETPGLDSPALGDTKRNRPSRHRPTVGPRQATSARFPLGRRLLWTRTGEPLARPKYGSLVTSEPSYISSVRSKIGNQLLLLPAATALIWDDSGRLLLVRHAFNGQWGTVGGIIEPDESPADAAVREAFEEVNLRVRLDRLRGAVGGPNHRVTYPNRDQCSYVTVVYDATIIDGTPGPDNTEVTELGWFTIDELKSADLGTYARALLGDLGII